jgi:tetratricopeptide (TPR) repeat protein
VTRLYEACLAQRLDRAGVVIAFGGGVVGDAAGFAAATYLRGVRLVQVPTTLLSQVDSAIGGKVGVNLPAGKNLVGAFHPPAMVVCDPDVLATLPRREFRAGLYEVVKYGVIGSRPLFDQIGAGLGAILDRDTSVLTPLVADCCRIKAHVVTIDERETGPRRALNFGHTIGHALEALTSYRRFRHGEAIAHGREERAGGDVALVALSNAADTTHTAMVRATAAGLLARYPSATSRDALGAALHDPDPLVRATAVRAMNGLGLEARRVALAPLLRDPYRAVRIAAVAQLAAVPRSMFDKREEAAFDAALDEYVASQRAESDQPGSYLNLGVLYADLGERERAEQSYLAAIAVDSSFVPARMNLAILYNEMGRNSDAERMLRQAIALDPTMGDAYYSLGLLLSEMAERNPALVPEAAAALERAASLLPDRARVQYNAALALDRAGRHREALEAITRAMRLEPGSQQIEAAAQKIQDGE